LLGGAAGLLAGVILAPRSGRELRGSIADRTGEARERGRETLFEAQERLQERRAAAREGSYRHARAADTDDADVVPPSPAEAAPRGPAPRRPRLREVPREVPPEVPHDFAEDASDETAEWGGERSEELRRKVRETRARLRERLDAPAGSEEGQEDHDDPGPQR
jgi:gas vesicle protein